MDLNKTDIHSMDFIICTNDTQWFSECEKYIRNLHVPDDMQIHVIPVWDAASMCSGYNIGMRQSSAKYKVYVHQDTFIINREFISDILRIFESDTQIGIIGVVGSEEVKVQRLSPSPWCYGSVLAYNGMSENLYEFGSVEGAYRQVDLVDGLLIATQYDIPWREDVFTGWDFYDKSICMEFRRQGYRTVVPKQSSPWCIHDCGPSQLLNWIQNKLLFIRTYHTYFSSETTETAPAEQLSENMLTQIHASETAAETAFCAGDYSSAAQIISDESKNGHIPTKKMVDILHLSVMALDDEEPSLLRAGDSLEMIRESFTKARFLLRRLCYGLSLNDDETAFLEQLSDNEKLHIAKTGLTYSAADKTPDSDTDAAQEATDAQPALDITQTIRELIRCKRIEEASEICISAVKNEYVDKELYIFFILFLIRQNELEMGQPQIFDISNDPDVLINHYHALKFFIRRQEFSQMEHLQNELFSYCKATNTSAAALEIITEFSTLEPEPVIQKILKGLNLYE